ncbi:Hypothetical Protein FCC1311_017881 [Hondaea fermentalgiana]|uniref:Uncharacterized protein n=1 Tax=Hondaea fermentalgiana TaxID=2315210 RepID=A0A2R5GRR3_9STRA|nr:Hypothetical Protein FCC1311_017881 [Hondaea fermentalgiana]|eukprot:GBG32448.1 Hypothetical Protein FCC1311_017881 [Hondaea fermentalgiana]
MTAQGGYRSEMLMYYEDTDLTGAIYAGNYFKYFERARDEAVGIDVLKTLMDKEGLALYVRKMGEMTFKGGAKHADTLVVESSVEAPSDFRLVFKQRASVKDRPETIIVETDVEVVCIDMNTQRVAKIPTQIREALRI